MFYFLLPLSESGRERGGLLLGRTGITAAITALFLRFGRRILCVNLLLLMLGGVLFGASFILGCHVPNDDFHVGDTRPGGHFDEFLLGIFLGCHDDWRLAADPGT